MMMEVVVSLQYNPKINSIRKSQTPYVEKGWIELGKKVPNEIADKFAIDLASGVLKFANIHQAVLAWHDYIFPYLTEGISS